MFNTLRKFFGKRGGATLDAPSESEQSEAVFTPPPSNARAVRVDAQYAPPLRQAAPANAPASINVPLKSIIGRLPADLMQRVRQMDVGEAEIVVATQKVISQISTGAVRISFGELRQLAPPGTFTAENDRDRTPVELPLYEILARLNPGLLMRRPAQRHVEVPADVVGPFGGQAKVTVSNANAKAAAPAPLGARPPVAAPPVVRSQPATPPAAPAMPRVAGPAAPGVSIARPARSGSGTPPVPVCQDSSWVIDSPLRAGAKAAADRRSCACPGRSSRQRRAGSGSLGSRSRAGRGGAHL